MLLLQLSPPTLADLDALLDFELRNRAFFEAHINARPADYYSREGVAAAIGFAEADARNDKAYQFLARDTAGRLVGRVNLTHVKRRHFHSAELGYRIAEADNGKGHAKEAVRLVLAKAFSELQLLRIEATARVGNAGSAQVLHRNGFSQFGRSTRSFQLDSVWHDLLHFERHADAPTTHVRL